MDRREFLRRGLMGLTLASGLPMSQLKAADKASRPNILFLFTDDQCFRTINVLNNKEVHTPNMDRLVRRGVTFTHCFNQGAWNGAICIASRAMLNTGRYVWTCGGNDCGNYPLWGETFTRAGYETYGVGKWHNGKATFQRSFKHQGPMGAGMYASKPVTKKDGDREKVYDPYNRPREDDFWSPSDTSLTGHWFDVEGNKIHSSQYWADHAIDFLNTTAKTTENPFFMYVAFNAPHDPRQSPQKYVDMYPPEKLTIPPNFMPEHPFDQGDHKVRDELLAPFPRTKEAVQVHLQEYYAIITHADYHIGRILDALEASGKVDNTIIVFSSDHGLALGQHGLMGKQNQYDHSIRMPLVLCGPGLEPERKIDALVYLQSMFATTCDLAGITIPESVQFPSLLPLLRGEKKNIYTSIYNGYRDLQRSVRTERYKLIRYPEVDEIQLFDLQNDPWELTDLAEKEPYQTLKKELDRQLHDWMKKTGDKLELAPL